MQWCSVRQASEAPYSAHISPCRSLWVKLIEKLCILGVLEQFPSIMSRDILWVSHTHDAPQQALKVPSSSLPPASLQGASLGCWRLSGLSCVPGM